MSGTRPSLRIGDADREVALAALGEHFAQGRLTREEHAERSDAVWSAKHAEDVAPLFADLPQGSPLGQVRATPRVAPTTGRRARDRFGGLPVPVQLVLVVVAAALVLAHLPLLLLAGVLWFVLSRHGVVGPPPWAGHRSGRLAARRGCAR